MLLAVLILSIGAGAGPCRAEEAAAQHQNPADEQGRRQMLRAYQDMAKAAEVSVYKLADDAGELRRAAASFPIKPYSISLPIEQEGILKGEALKNLLAAWMGLSTQSGYRNAMCHEPVYGLRFRDERGQIVFETSLCWGCSNYYLAEGNDYIWSGLPKSHLADSRLKQQLDGLFSQ